VEQLRAGELRVICTVDVFNEGLDVPEVDTVLMLRSTESPVVFLQQLGRGLRRSDGKDALTVIDFIGNHRSFLIKPRTLLALGTGREASTAKVLQAMRTGDFGLPPGCSASAPSRPATWPGWTTSACGLTGSCATRRCMTEWRWKTSTVRLSWQPGEAEGSLTRETPGRAGSGPDNAGTCWHCQTARVRLARTERRT
jgi:hypothetical protein